MMDFFVKLGQALVPSEDNSPPPVAYLGSLFFDQLRKGGVQDGRAGHANVANWAKRRLGKGGLFSDTIGALAIPVNEMLKDDHGQATIRKRRTFFRYHWRTGNSSERDVEGRSWPG